MYRVTFYEFKFLMYLSFLFRDRVIDAKSFKRDHNIGTVLFERNDYGKQCWTNEEFAILNSRRMFQDILPQVNPVKNPFINVNYYLKNYEVKYFIINQKF